VHWPARPFACGRRRVRLAGRRERDPIVAHRVPERRGVGGISGDGLQWPGTPKDERDLRAMVRAHAATHRVITDAGVEIDVCSAAACGYEPRERTAGCTEDLL